jgi:Trypsin-co-occurring domain 1
LTPFETTAHHAKNKNAPVNEVAYMSRVFQYESSNGPIYIEVAGAEGPSTGIRKAGVGDKAKACLDKATASFEDALSNALTAANAFVETASKIKVQPQELNIEFGLKLSGDLNLFVVSGNSEANFVIKMKWSQHGSSPAG